MVKYSDEQLDAVFGALSDATRPAILERLAEGDASVTELAEPFEMSLPAISKHLRILEEAGFLMREKDGRVHRMQLDTKALKSATAWLDRYRRFWDGRFDALEQYLSKKRQGTL